jgi:5-methylcytosine-specific restriction endonuclease McrA
MNPLKIEALKRDHHRCQKKREDGSVCGRTERLTMHHIIPRRMGGADELDNVVIWCWDCHKRYNRNQARTRRRLYKVRKESKWTIDWVCRPGIEKCANCNKFVCLNWPEGFLEALWRLLTGKWPVAASSSQ